MTRRIYPNETAWCVYWKTVSNAKNHVYSLDVLDGCHQTCDSDNAEDDIWNVASDYRSKGSIFSLGNQVKCASDLQTIMCSIQQICNDV
jgi:hypothetical protein